MQHDACRLGDFVYKQATSELGPPLEMYQTAPRPICQSTAQQQQQQQQQKVFPSL